MKEGERKSHRVWSDAEVAILRRQYSTTATLKQLAKTLGRSYESLKYKVASLGITKTDPEAIRLAYMSRPQSVQKAANRKAWEDIPRLDKFVHLSGDIALAADFHVPFTDVGMMRVFGAVAKKRGIRQAAILGDFFDGNEFSHWVATGLSPLEVKFGDELQYAAQAMEELIAAFPGGVYFLRGNHDERPLRLLRYALDTQDMYALIGRRMARGVREHMEKVVRISEYPFCHLNSSWFLCHPASYSKLPMAVARDVAEVERMHVVCGNGHLWGMCMDRSGGHYCIDTGAMCDRQKMHYAVMKIRRFPRWVPGFTLIRNNLPLLYDEAMALAE